MNPRQEMMSYFFDHETDNGWLMEKDELSVEDLERLAAAMAAAIPNLECPECCDCGWVYQYVEKSAGFFREEWEWACFASAVVQYRLTRKSEQSGSN